MLFAFQGQSVFLEIMREMKQPQRFGLAVQLANASMALLYGIAIAIGYGARGSAVAAFLPDSMLEGPAKVCISPHLPTSPLLSPLSPLLPRPSLTFSRPPG